MIAAPLALTMAFQPMCLLAQDRLDAPAGTRVVQVETIPALADYARARAEEANVNDEAAIVSYRQILPYATDPAVASQIFRTALVVGDNATALAVIRPVTDMSALPMEAPLLLIADAVRAGKWDEARRLTATMNEEAAFGFLAPSLKALIDMGARKADPFQALNGLKRSSLDYNYAQRTKALMTTSLGSPAEIMSVSKSLQLSGQDTAIMRLALADRLATLGDKENALKLLNANDPLTLAARSKVSAGGKIGTIVSTPAQAMALLLSDLANELAKEKVTSLALSLQRIANVASPDNAAFPVLLGNYLATEDHPDMALKMLAGVKPKSTFYEVARVQQVDILVGEGRGAEAQAIARQWTKADPRSALAWEAMGNALLASGDDAGAIAAYRKQLTLMPEGSALIWRPHFLIGQAQQKAGRWPEARLSYEAALAVAPKEPSVLNALGQGMLQNGDGNEKAIGYLRTARMLDPANPQYADSLGWAYVLAGDAERGVAILESAVKLAPGDPAYNEHLGDAYWLSGRKVDARYSWTAARIYADPAHRQVLDARIRDGVPRQ